MNGAGPVGLKAAQQPVEEIVSRAQGRFGVAARDLTTGEEIGVNLGELFPLASVFKVAVLVELFRQVENGEVSLVRRLRFNLEDRMPGSGVLRELEPGLALTIRDYATLMIILSDNSATDKVIGVVGRRRINRTLRELGLEDIYVSRTCGQLLASLAGFEVECPTPEQVEEITARLRRNERAESTWVYSEAPENNVATPLAMVGLFELIYRGKAASREACTAMLDILRRQQQRQRLPLLLPPSVVMAHKTGTLPGVVNDAGLIWIAPERAVAIAVLSKNGADRVGGQQTVAEIGRAVYEAAMKTA